MDSFFNYVVWAPAPELSSLFFLKIRWYGLLFALGFILALQLMYLIFKKEGKPGKDVEALAIYMIIAAIIGARLGHVFFFEPRLYLSDPIKILMIWEGGLAGFGAAIGVIIAVLIYRNYQISINFRKFKIKKKKREGQSYLWIVDRIVIVTALIASLIRVGNLLNSEFIGKPTDSDWGFVFAWEAKEQLLSDNLVNTVKVQKPENTTDDNNSDDQTLAPLVFTAGFVTSEYKFKEENVRSYIEDNLENNLNFHTDLRHLKISEDHPFNYSLSQQGNTYVATIEVLGVKRHPVQLYEAISSFLIFLVLLIIWSRKKDTTKPGLLFGVFLTSFFTLHFIYLFFLDVLSYRMVDLPLTLEQWMSIPMILSGVFLLIYIHRKRKGQHSSQNVAHPIK